ncbi:hypothetical protein BESB_068750 [Besnoitia besnoiti]|uniref:Uncharacterized protein n=1 Tax=Besnoitia besnoiti TaxID=94643 RepID=A0A2A9MHF8_BESBE|nr:hypothetical protein BESB_068750 [Besnoitia besnoiti]PFH34842.1 hypothetical protein BESB_068750 [Besnoitia besnoiti]
MEETSEGIHSASAAADGQVFSLHTEPGDAACPAQKFFEDHGDRCQSEETQAFPSRFASEASSSSSALASEDRTEDWEIARDRNLLTLERSSLSSCLPSSPCSAYSPLSAASSECMPLVPREAEEGDKSPAHAFTLFSVARGERSDPLSAEEGKSGLSPFVAVEPLSQHPPQTAPNLWGQPSQTESGCAGLSMHALLLPSASPAQSEDDSETEDGRADVVAELREASTPTVLSPASRRACVLSAPPGAFSFASCFSAFLSSALSPDDPTEPKPQIASPPFDAGASGEASPPLDRLSPRMLLPSSPSCSSSRPESPLTGVEETEVREAAEGAREAEPEAPQPLSGVSSVQESRLPESGDAGSRLPSQLPSARLTHRLARVPLPAPFSAPELRLRVHLPTQLEQKFHRMVITTHPCVRTLDVSSVQLPYAFSLPLPTAFVQRLGGSNEELSEGLQDTHAVSSRASNEGDSCSNAAGMTLQTERREAKAKGEFAKNQFVTVIRVVVYCSAPQPSPSPSLASGSSLSSLPSFSRVSLSGASFSDHATSGETEVKPVADAPAHDSVGKALNAPGSCVYVANVPLKAFLARCGSEAQGTVWLALTKADAKLAPLTPWQMDFYNDAFNRAVATGMEFSRPKVAISFKLTSGEGHQPILTSQSDSRARLAKRVQQLEKEADQVYRQADLEIQRYKAAIKSAKQQKGKVKAFLRDFDSPAFKQMENEVGNDPAVLSEAPETSEEDRGGGAGGLDREGRDDSEAAARTENCPPAPSIQSAAQLCRRDVLRRRLALVLVAGVRGSADWLLRPFREDSGAVAQRLGALSGNHAGRAYLESRSPPRVPVVLRRKISELEEENLSTARKLEEAEKEKDALRSELRVVKRNLACQRNRSKAQSEALIGRVANPKAKAPGLLKATKRTADALMADEKGEAKQTAAAQTPERQTTGETQKRDRSILSVRKHLPVPPPSTASVGSSGSASAMSSSRSPLIAPSAASCAAPSAQEQRLRAQRLSLGLSACGRRAWGPPRVEEELLSDEEKLFVSPPLRKALSFAALFPSLAVPDTSDDEQGDDSETRALHKRKGSDTLPIGFSKLSEREKKLLRELKRAATQALPSLRALTGFQGSDEEEGALQAREQSGPATDAERIKVKATSGPNASTAEEVCDSESVSVPRKGAEKRENATSLRKKAKRVPRLPSSQSIRPAGIASAKNRASTAASSPSTSRDCGTASASARASSPTLHRAATASCGAKEEPRSHSGSEASPERGERRGRADRRALASSNPRVSSSSTSSRAASSSGDRAARSARAQPAAKPRGLLTQASPYRATLRKYLTSKSQRELKKIQDRLLRWASPLRRPAKDEKPSTLVLASYHDGRPLRLNGSEKRVAMPARHAREGRSGEGRPGPGEPAAASSQAVAAQTHACAPRMSAKTEESSSNPETLARTPATSSPALSRRSSPAGARGSEGPSAEGAVSFRARAGALKARLGREGGCADGRCGRTPLVRSCSQAGQMANRSGATGTAARAASTDAGKGKAPRAASQVAEQRTGSPVESPHAARRLDARDDDAKKSGKREDSGLSARNASGKAKGCSAEKRLSTKQTCIWHRGMSKSVVAPERTESGVAKSPILGEVEKGAVLKMVTLGVKKVLVFPGASAKSDSERRRGRAASEAGKEARERALSGSNAPAAAGGRGRPESSGDKTRSRLAAACVRRSHGKEKECEKREAAADSQDVGGATEKAVDSVAAVRECALKPAWADAQTPGSADEGNDQASSFASFDALQGEQQERRSLGETDAGDDELQTNQVSRVISPAVSRCRLLPAVLGSSGNDPADFFASTEPARQTLAGCGAQGGPGDHGARARAATGARAPASHVEPREEARAHSLPMDLSAVSASGAAAPRARSPDASCVETRGTGLIASHPLVAAPEPPAEKMERLEIRGFSPSTQRLARQLHVTLDEELSTLEPYIPNGSEGDVPHLQGLLVAASEGSSSARTSSGRSDSRRRVANRKPCGDKRVAPARVASPPAADSSGAMTLAGAAVRRIAMRAQAEEAACRKLENRSSKDASLAEGAETRPAARGAGGHRSVGQTPPGPVGDRPVPSALPDDSRRGVDAFQGARHPLVTSLARGSGEMPRQGQVGVPSPATAVGVRERQDARSFNCGSQAMSPQFSPIASSRLPASYVPAGVAKPDMRASSPPAIPQRDVRAAQLRQLDTSLATLVQQPAAWPSCALHTGRGSSPPSHGHPASLPSPVGGGVPLRASRGGDMLTLGAPAAAAARQTAPSPYHPLAAIPVPGIAQVASALTAPHTYAEAHPTGRMQATVVRQAPSASAGSPLPPSVQERTQLLSLVSAYQRQLREKDRTLEGEGMRKEGGVSAARWVRREDLPSAPEAAAVKMRERLCAPSPTFAPQTSPSFASQGPSSAEFLRDPRLAAMAGVTGAGKQQAVASLSAAPGPVTRLAPPGVAYRGCADPLVSPSTVKSATFAPSLARLPPPQLSGNAAQSVRGSLGFFPNKMLPLRSTTGSLPEAVCGAQPFNSSAMF